jgi:hypothetical protein
LVNNLPEGTQLYDVTRTIRAGRLVCSQLHTIGGRLSARLVFFNGKDAVKFYHDSTNERTPLMFEGKAPEVVLIPIPSYPAVNMHTLRHWQTLGATEKLIIYNFHLRSSEAEIAGYLLHGREAIHVTGIVHLERLEHGGVSAEFGTVELAVWVVEKLKAETNGLIVADFV